MASQGEILKFCDWSFYRGGIEENVLRFKIKKSEKRQLRCQKTERNLTLTEPSIVHIILVVMRNKKQYSRAY